MFYVTPTSFLHWLYKMIVQVLFKEVQQFSPFSKKVLKWQNIVVFKYYCIIETLYVYLVTVSLASNWIFC